MNIYLLLTMFLVVASVIGIAAAALHRSKANGKTILQKAAILLAADLILLYAADLFLFQFTLYNNTAQPLFGIAFAEIALTASIFLIRPKKNNLHKFLDAAVRIICLTLMLELVVFCGKCYSFQPVSDNVKFSDAGIDVAFSNERAVLEEMDILVCGDTDVTLSLNTDHAKYLMFDTDTLDMFYQVTLRISDNNFSLDPQKFGHTWMNASQKILAFPVDPYEMLYNAKLIFRNVNEETPIRLTGLTITNVKPYSFSLVRFFGLAAVLSFLAAVKIFAWYKISYNRKLYNHRAIVLAVLLFCLSATYWVFPSYKTELLPYTIEDGVGTYDPYAQTFDAWQRGQVHLAVEADPVLSEIENPYDRSLRDEYSAVTEWDKAFYNGKYYSYFGIAPVIFVYYPIYLLTGKIPNVTIAAGIFSMLSVSFLFGFMMAAVRRYGRRVNFLLLLCGLIASSAASGIVLCAHYADRYYVAISAGICFLYLFLWLGLEAVMAKKQIPRCILLAGCGLAISAAVLSRPPMALYAVLLIPPFLKFICRKDLRVPQKTASVTSFAVPLLIGAAVTMAYNAARFGSPLDFGSAYQLTVSNTAANRVSLSEIPAALTYYFLNPVAFNGVFPFIEQTGPSFSDTSHYVYLNAGFGAFMFPMIPAAILLLRYVCRNSTLEKRWVFCMAFAVSVVLAFIDYCVGGYNSRYLCDFLPILAVFSVLTLLHVQRQTRTLPALNGTFSRISAVLMILAPVFMFALLLSLGEHFSIWTSNPEFYFDLHDLIVFWR